jgi:hypothetical protein
MGIRLSSLSLTVVSVALLVLSVLLSSFGSKTLLLLGIDEIVVVGPFRVVIRDQRHSHALEETSLLAESNVLDLELLDFLVVGDGATEATEILVGTAGRGLHIVDLVAKGKILLTLVGQLLAVVFVPGEGIGLVLFLKLVHLLQDVGEDVCAVNGQLPVLILVILALVKLLA